MLTVFPANGTCRCGQPAAAIVCHNHGDEDESNPPLCLSCLMEKMGWSRDQAMQAIALARELVANALAAHVTAPPP